MSLNPSTLLMFEGLPQFQASWTANATIAWSSRIRASSACGSPIPQAFIGCDPSVQFRVSLLQPVVAKPRMPIPDRMFHVATLNVAADPRSTAITVTALGSAGVLPHPAAPSKAAVTSSSPALPSLVAARLCGRAWQAGPVRRPPARVPRTSENRTRRW
jgi:hypothetical protein